MRAESASGLLDPEVIASAEALGFHARRIVEGLVAGDNRSPFHGVALEFSRHRAYAPGDDTRHLDWKILGRTDRAFVKEYEQETNYTAHVLLDGSLSMNYGPGRVTKLEYGKALAACLSYLVLSQRDAAQVGVFDKEIRALAPRVGMLAGLDPVLRALAEFRAEGRTQIGPVLHRMAERISRRGIVIVISDLFDDERAFFGGLQHLRFAGHEVIVFHVLDADELAFPFSGPMAFEDLETGETVAARAEDVRDGYLRKMAEFTRSMREGCAWNDSHYVLADTGRSLRETLGGYLEFRSRPSYRSIARSV